MGDGGTPPPLLVLRVGDPGPAELRPLSVAA
jgi:hypothetical protein